MIEIKIKVDFETREIHKVEGIKEANPLEAAKVLLQVVNMIITPINMIVNAFYYSADGLGTSR